MIDILMRSEVKTITPAKAQVWLEKNEVNRPVSQGHVQFLADQITRGLWQLNGEAIVFSRTGQLLDGQHRLWAVVESNQPITSLVVYDAEEETRFTIDIGHKRTSGNALAMIGTANANRAASIIRAVFVLAYQSEGKKISPQQCVVFSKKYDTSIQSAVAAINGLPSLIPARWIGAVHFIASQYLTAGALADKFAEVFKTGTPSYAGDPAHAARELFVRVATKSTSLRVNDQINVILRAWDAFKDGSVRRTQVRHVDIIMSWDIEGFNQDMFEASL